MPIAAGVGILAPQIISALSMGPAAQQSTVAALIGVGLASIIPLGIFPPAPVPIPLIPAGIGVTINQIEGALKMGQAAQISVTGNMIAAAISIAAPQAIPVGMMFLASQISNALSMGPAAQQSTVGQLIAANIIIYYSMGGVL